MAKLVNKSFKFPSRNSKFVKPPNLPRYVHYNADISGCGFWRMHWLADQLSINKKAMVNSVHQMILDPRFYGGVSAVRLQRQCNETQYKFINFLKKVSEAMYKSIGKSFKLIWEVDDVVGPPHSIPDYNKYKDGFTSPFLIETVKRIVHECDEITVVSKRMAKHYSEWLSHDKITVIPNYLMRDWADGYYDPNKVMESYDRNKNKPRIGYAGSPTHFDVSGRNNWKDDFSHVVEDIIKKVNDYQFVMFGGYPKILDPYVKSGQIEYHPWSSLSQYMRILNNLDLNIMIAPLLDNDFSSSKSNIKLLEASALGLPCICQDLDPYEKSPWKFKTSEEMFEKIDLISLDENTYKHSSDIARSIADDNWLDNHLDEIQLIYDTPYGDLKRKENKHFFENNKNQFDKVEIPTYTV